MRFIELHPLTSLEAQLVYQLEVLDQDDKTGDLPTAIPYLQGVEMATSATAQVQSILPRTCHPQFFFASYGAKGMIGNQVYNKSSRRMFLDDTVRVCYQPYRI